MKRNITLLISLLMLLLPLSVMADDIPIRYVKTSQNGGSYSNGGTSWADAKNNVQEAIDVLYAYMTENKISEGRVYVAAGTYYPSSSTETGNDDRQHLSFIIYPGVHVYGGFAGNETDMTKTPEDRPRGQYPWSFVNPTILSGNISENHTEPSFTYNSAQGTYKTIFYGNSYHVVWFATNGFIEVGKDVNYDWDESSLSGHGRALPYPASVDGCTISGGYAATQSNSGHVHTGYGAGAYMVENSSLVNCVVERCLAVTNGGGVYMDGGGLVDNCYIHTCQATGQNVLDGLGGGVCVSFDGAVKHSYIVNNSSRSGGGVAISHLEDEYPWRSRNKENGVAAQYINTTKTNDYSPYATACIVSNNSSTNEAGGVFLNNGGVANHLTVTNNKCFGSDVLYYGRRQGRSGGFYILNGGQIYNSVAWGNECEANNDIQYACHTSGSTETLKPHVYYSAFDKHESTDWSGTIKTNVYSLASGNLNPGNNANYPVFIGKGDGIIEVVSTVTQVEPAGGVESTTHDNPKGAGFGLKQQKKEEGVTKEYYSGDIPLPEIWRPASVSDLIDKGVQVTEALSGSSEWIRHAHTNTDMLGGKYKPVSILGALIHQEENIRPALSNSGVPVIPNQEKELYSDYESNINKYTDNLVVHEEHSLLPDAVGGEDKLPTLFVDPSRKLTNIGENGIGSSWETPMAHINDAIDYFRQCLVKDGDGKIVYDANGDVTYRIPCAWDGGGNPIDWFESHYVQILVKGASGSLITTTAGRGGYLGEELRSAAIRPCSNMRIYGGYDPDATGTTTTGRNQRQHPTRISGNIIGDYENNSTHVFALTNVKNVIIDGFRIYEGNANNATEISGDVARGGGIILDNESVAAADRIDMTGNILRNSAIAHCSAPEAAAIYVNSVDDKEVELHILNTVIRNNTAGDGSDVTKNGHEGVIVARGEKALVRMDHCDLLNNCGYPIKTQSIDGVPEHEGSIKIYNSVIYANGNKKIDNRKNIEQALCFNGNDNRFQGDYLFIDWDAVTPSTFSSTHINKVFCRDMSDQYQKWGIWNESTNEKRYYATEEQASAGASGGGWTDPVYLDYPFFVNPAKNVGHSIEGDKPMNGGSIDYMPQATNPMVNAAIDDSRYLWDTDNICRTYGGDPDIGAIESTELPIGGSIIYVTPDGAGKRDGSSWDNAIAGNTIYRLNNAPAVGGDQLDGDRIINTDASIGKAAENGVPTTDSRYLGFSKSYVQSKTEGGETTTITQTYTTEKNVYVGGDNDGQVDYLKGGVNEDGELTESSVTVQNEYTTPSDFVAGLQDVPRFPYGEMSGQSRAFWRATGNISPIPDNWWPGQQIPFKNNKSITDDYGVVRTGTKNGSISEIVELLHIGNTRAENYVSGLQYAVEKATAYNTLAEGDAGRINGVESIQVWVSNGIYEDYKGYIMRDKTTVMGSFPAVKQDGTVVTPGLSERQALMSHVVSIPKSINAKDLDPVDYETVLQISEINPIISGANLNSTNVLNRDAVKYTDDDLNWKQTNNITITEIYDDVITHTYTWNGTEYVLSEASEHNLRSTNTNTETTNEFTVVKTRPTIRKRVLCMPDVTQPNYSPGRPGCAWNFCGDENFERIAHTDRVTGDVAALRKASQYTRYPDDEYVAYSNVVWDGFTIRHGFIYDQNMNHGGGAGVSMFEGAILRNCIITDNFAGARRMKGGGVFCDGATSTIEGCFILNNISTRGTNTLQNQQYTGGLFMYEGTCFNSLIANNYANGRGGGVGLCMGKFYNNTVAYNRRGVAGGGVALAVANSNVNLFMANTIIYGNQNEALFAESGNVLLSPFIHCYIQSANQITDSRFINAISTYGISNTFYNKVNPSKDNTPFAADINKTNGNYLSTNGAKDNNDYRLRIFTTNNNSSGCVNAGTIDFEGNVRKAVKIQHAYTTDQQAEDDDLFKSVKGLELPSTDVAFAERVQDCQVDIGAYEYDAAMDIHPNYELIDFTDKDGNVSKELCAVYYVTANGNDGGDSSGSSPENAACAKKLQEVLDAAGRLKYDLSQNSRIFSTTAVQVTGTVTAKEEVYDNGLVTWVDRTDQNLTDVKHVIVKLADGAYMPDRSTNNKMATGQSEDEILTHSLIIPHGVELWGGYKFDNGDGDFFEYTRDILTHKSILLSGVRNARSGSIGKAYHVVTFTNHLFDLDGGMFSDKDEEAELLDMEDRAILDGVFIQDGDASGVEENDKHGGAAVVTDYAHIRNCIIYDNAATKQGGGLYLMPGALVSGCIFKDNTADEGGAIYVAEPTKAQLASYSDVERDKAYARVYNSTIINNTASVKGGGIFFETNIRAKGVVMWQNSANDMNDVAGTFDSEAIQADNNYPFSYCTVQNRRLPGVNNQEVTGQSSEGVRWKTDESLIYWKGESVTTTINKTEDNYFEYQDFDGFYYIDRVSALVRTGMPYVMYKNLRHDYPTLEMTDMAGVSRMDYNDVNDAKGADYKTYFGPSNELVTKANKYLEIGARALNTQMDLEVDKASVYMTRLFVAKPENVNSEKANALLTSDDELYKQQGSSMVNPFTKFSDALDYIVKLRNYKKGATDDNETAESIRQKYANTRFEIFVAGGNYYPYQNPEGEEGKARSSTFVLPEAVTIIGGLNPSELYCQAGYDFVDNQPAGNNDKSTNDFLNGEEELPNKEINGVVLERKVTDEVREERERFDLNNNNVYEPWEFKKETVFSGNTPRGNENEDNVFHVFTCFADPNRVGTLPDIDGPDQLRKRMIILDGFTVKEGNARDYESGTGSINNKKMFYRGGGILVDGSWDDATTNSNEPDLNPDARGIRDIPLTISDCLFQDNNAVQGGAIFTNGTLNVFSSSFVKNYSRGPVTNKNQSISDSNDALAAIKYAGGGAIATTGDLFCVNTIFANNEAMLGDGIKTIPESANGYRKQGFGGVIWGGEDSNVKLLNCNLVNNQAVSYPGVYLATQNNTGENGLRHFGINTVFWGNKATGVPTSLSGSFSHIIEINDDIITFRSMPEKRRNDSPTGVETLYFCAYEEGTGPEALKATEPPHAIAFDGTWSNIRESMKGSNGTYYNNNVIINADNDDVDGPNFQMPSSTPGKDGYNASANWMASRVNKLTDNGWSYLTVHPNNKDEMVFKVEDTENSKAYQVDPDGRDDTGGIFNWNSYQFYEKFGLNLMPLGSVDLTNTVCPRNYYMKFEGVGMTDQMAEDGKSYMQRISSNPLTRGEYNAYIDIGVYEYQHRTLKINQGSEVDVIWITEKENPQTGNDGYSWETATSNVQVAIETLLKSRNNHGKRLNIIAGSYKPMTVVEGNLGYTIRTSAYNDGVYTPFKTDGTTADEYGVKYINLRGGYDKQIPDEGGYDYQKNQVVFSMEQRTGVKEEELNHILNIADVEQYKTTVTPTIEGTEITGFTVSSSPKGSAIPVIVEGITFENTLAQGIDASNPGGAAISYKKQYKHEEGHTSELLEAPEDGSYKLMIRNCTFSSNGKDVENPSSAILIDEGAGEALIVNSVFHSNSGKPVDAVNTVVLNCTSAMNGDHITLSGDDSQLHNSVIWQDDQKIKTGNRRQFEMVQISGSSEDVEAYLKLDGAGEIILGESDQSLVSNRITNNAITGLGSGLPNNNEPLSNTNNDLEEGPNFLFMNPNDPDPTKRDFRIRPSLRLLDRGDNLTYANFVWKDYIGEDVIDINGVLMEQYMALMQNKHPHQTQIETFTTKIREGDIVKEIEYDGYRRDKDLDRAFVARLMNEKIDRGAYECTGKGQRIVYVNPEKYGTGGESGSTWEDALGRGNLQRAIDAAAVYVRNRESKAQNDNTIESQIAYVFVKGENMYNEGEITLRDGVHVYGTAPISVEIEEQTDQTDADYETYLNGKLDEMKSERVGIVFKSLKAEAFTPTYCSSLESMGEYRLGSVFDGLMVNNSVDNVSDKPVVKMASDAKVAIRNCLIIHNNVGPDKDKNPQPVVDLQGGLLYNTLIYNGLGGDVVKVGSNGYVLNCTVIADDKYQRAVTYNNETSGTDYDAHVANTIAINQGATQKMFAPYMKEGGNQYTPEDYLTNHRPYWYQLHEESSEIDNATYKTDSEVKVWLPEVTTTYGTTDYSINYDEYVNFNTDRDLLGNPRMINGSVDNGCFETWRIPDGTDNAHRTVVTTSPDNHYYPHPGSVVYIGKYADLVLGTKSGSTNPMFDADNSFLPGYLLVKEGGSLYGAGNYVTASYVAVERSISSQYSLISVPFRCNPLNTIIITSADGAITQTKPSGLTGSTYDGEERAKWNYHYMAENSTCWKPQSDFIPANQGWLLSLKEEPASATTYRFTGWGETRTSYIYTENGDDKTVTLTQYNNLPDDGSAHFTKEENMGWNLVGLPWLVSGYKTYAIDASGDYDSSSHDYQMNVPHVFYSNLSKGLTEPAAGSYTDGQFYTGQSWADGSTLSPGEGFFTQTAVLGETETLTFKLPVYIGTAPVSPVRQRIGIRHQSGNSTRSAVSARFDDVVDVYPQEGADVALDYRLGSDGIKWMAFNKSLAQIYVENTVGTRMSLVSAAPVETEISLGVTVPEAGDYAISLPQPEAYADYEAVWVIDKMTGASANLLNEDFVLSVNEGGDISNRLKLKFGGLKPEINSPVVQMPDVIKVAARYGRLPMRGIADETEIRVRNASGALVYQGSVAGCHSQYLPDGVYFISPLQK